MLKFLYSIVLIAVLLPVLKCTAQDVNPWKRVTEDSFINTDGIMGTEDVYGYSFILKSYNKGQYEPVNGQKIWYTLSRYTIDCGKNLYKIGVIDSYGYRDNFVNGDYNRYATFQPVVEGTAISEISKKLCRP